MNKAEMIIVLAQDTAKEQEYFKEYRDKEKEFPLKRNEDIPLERDVDYWNARREYFSMRAPSKARIKDNLKMIRRLALEIQKEE